MNDVDRKNGHIDLALQQQDSSSDFDQVRLRHRALPEVNFQDIDLSVQFLSYKLSAPLFVSSMTGGPLRAERINRHLAEAVCELGLAMGVGSQRIAIEQGKKSGMTSTIRDAIGRCPLMANFGAVNLLTLKSISDLGYVLDPLEADAIILHLNPMQEIFQCRGDTNWKGVLDAIDAVCSWAPVPVVVKEVGFGLDRESAKRLLDAGVSVLDVAGLGGTRFDEIEQELAAGTERPEISNTAFKNWGYSTVESLRALHSDFPDSTLWASGGIRDGLDIAKSLCLGASAAGVAGTVLGSALESTDAVIARLSRLIYELKIACFGTGVSQVTQLNECQIMEEK
ncbi:type 2 isopentenyl-diphosphate Delta-isomerase [Litorivicinus sp.]|nr:type 2 isopentenyl-diphosphate Delta-isomerase [Litorivicinus sp.]